MLACLGSHRVVLHSPSDLTALFVLHGYMGHIGYVALGIVFTFFL